MKKINSILIANRGEIASRVIRTCKKMGIRTIAIFSEADRNAPFVKQASQAVFIGASNLSDSYLNQEKIIVIAQQTKADAIHPGYGFLSENAEFAKLCRKENIIFIGPSTDVIALMGSKAEAKVLMQKNNVPILLGYQGKDQSIEALTKAAIKIGFPILLKASAGGGGKGMRIVHHADEIESAIHSAKRESKNAFGEEQLIVEKYIASARHLEIQIFGDQHGNVIHLLERECTIQRRYQKIIEESPSPIMDEALRLEMTTTALNIAKTLKYDNAGTVEFIYDEQSKQFFFLEVNTRLQVEHTVTEEITGLDLVQMQIEVAQGLPLNIQQHQIKANGYAIEARLYAEDANNNFLPVTGTIHQFEVPDVAGLRIETSIESGSEISIFYDPMIAKIIVWDSTRHNALRKMQYVLRNLICLGVKTNQDFLLKILEQEDFQNGKYDTQFISENIALASFKKKNKTIHSHSAIAATLYLWKQREENRTLLNAIPSGWRNNFYTFQQETYIIEKEEVFIQYRFQKNAFLFLIKEKSYSVSLIDCHQKQIRIEIDGVQFLFNIAHSGNDFFIHNEDLGNIQLSLKERFPIKEAEKIKGGYQATMPSQVIKVLVKEEQLVEVGDPLIVLSSMKMESTIYASEAGVVKSIFVKEAQNVPAEFILLEIFE